MHAVEEKIHSWRKDDSLWCYSPCGFQAYHIHFFIKVWLRSWIIEECVYAGFQTYSRSAYGFSDFLIVKRWFLELHYHWRWDMDVTCNLWIKTIIHWVETYFNAHKKIKDMCSSQKIMCNILGNKSNYWKFWISCITVAQLTQILTAKHIESCVVIL